MHNSNQNGWSIKKIQNICIRRRKNSRETIVVTNNRLDTILIKQLSDEDAVVLEVIIDNKKSY